uniref:Uncharacterized protein n=1 Tax=Fibrocapsa japonica TaxID=94617 RepID=A0A7S2V3P0_9STRA|mmetsp:Transcript_23203/g.33720  ORF Transcript_23203/g.33720 Transcript_23203/m.33720 type:complete len:261 (+) Transcript_23203:59-841(+)|eukprot:CAMPEP_0113936150 /NCGR_PEP_ID=MMETSP1339-20121228/3122_1 /TAXON_ID=94617 /ORGANISM="Fibrocapsa japonica" /LENGTH=260 /DNA_ID=CAMNT_0000938511 /DNA_START=58 /DNA_END=840 /DNA_ORIENTATION=+ /assembly_acc=CAM_ASM_000762
MNTAMSRNGSGMVGNPIPDHYLSQNQIADQNTTDLYDAASAGKIAEIERLIKAGANPNWFNMPQGGITSLHVACDNNHKAAVEALLAAGADAMIVPVTTNNTVLHYPACKGHMELAQLLLSTGSGPQLVQRANAFGNTALHEACIHGHLDMARLLLDNGADLKATNHHGSTPLHFVCYCDNGPADLAEFLINQGCDPKAKDGDGNTPLHVAALKANKAICQLLLNRGASKNDLNNQNKAANFFAELSGNSELASLLNPGN